MPSKTSKPSREAPLIRRSPWKAARACSEAALRLLALELALELAPGDRVLLEGPLGAGKTTFARFLLEGLGVRQPPEGSPTFALVHEYEGRGGVGVAHIDLYRLRSEAEIDEAGIPAYFSERRLIVLCEWLSAWPDFERAVLRSTGTGRCFGVSLGFPTGSDALLRRDAVIETLS